MSDTNATTPPKTLYEQVQDLRAAGMTVEEACKKLGVHFSKFYQEQRLLGKGQSSILQNDVVAWRLGKVREVDKLREEEGLSGAQATKKVGVSYGSYYMWKKTGGQHGNSGSKSGRERLRLELGDKEQERLEVALRPVLQPKPLLCPHCGQDVRAGFEEILRKLK